MATTKIASKRPPPWVRSGRKFLRISNSRLGNKEGFVNLFKDLLKTEEVSFASPRKNGIPNVMSIGSDASLHDEIIRKQSSILDSEELEDTSKVVSEENQKFNKGSNLETKLKSRKEDEDYEYASSRNLISIIADDISSSFVTKCKENSIELKIFSGDSVPEITLNDYLFRCVKYMNLWYKDAPDIKSVGMRSLVTSIIYINRIQTAIPELKLTAYNIHILMMVTILLAAKFYEDRPITNAFWAKVAGVSVKLLNNFEKSFCMYTNFNLYVENETIQEIYDQYIINDL